MDNRYVAAAEFKANCLRLMDEVAQQRRPIIITKRGKPVAKLVPIEAEAIDLFGRMAGSIKICGDIINPIEDAGWTGDEENSDRDVLLLDTHVWLWLVAGSSDLSTEARNAIERATAVGALRIAAISLWEVVLLASHGRIVLGKSIGPWLEEALADPGPTIDPLSPQIAIESYALPEAFHRDPADRLIVATARVANATLMTRDQRILDYAARGHLSAITA